MNKYNDTFLMDKEFLRLLDQDREKEVFVKIISLDFNENPLEEIEGRVVSGSVNVDGTSSVRRTCSLSLVAEELNIHAFYWSLNSKFKLYVGVKNTIKTRLIYKEQYKDYPDICWFKMGTYIISTFNTSQTLNAYTINISGKDKMAFLNGEVGGIVPSLSWDFGKIDQVDANGMIKTTSYLIKNIILESVHEYAQEPYWNIIINDVDDYGLELLEYRGDIPLYLLYNIEQEVVDNMIFNLSQITSMNEDDIIFDYHIQQLVAPEATKFNFNNTFYTIIKVEYGDVIGYRITDLTYPGDLISNVGETLTSMLDKIVNMLGNFEYFYDLDGRFIFQRKKTYIQSTFSTLSTNADNEIIITNAAGTSACSYSFDNSVLITSFANTPNLAEIKNDFSIWGVRKGISGVEIPIHLRYAIDSKPWMYTNYNGEVFITPEGKEKYEQLMQAYEDWIMSQQLEEINNSRKILFKKTPVPSFLQNEYGSSDWWDITNWAEYYYLLTGNYPDQILKTYGTQGFLGTINLPNGESINRISGEGQLIIDLEKDTHNLFYGNYYNGSNRKVGYKWITTNGDPQESESSWNPLQHGFSNCYHTYAQFLYLNANNNCQSFIYKPQLPTSALTDEVISLMDNIIIEDLSLNEDALICDWRELIYQMSIDYNRYHHDADFLEKIDNKNVLPNYTHLYPGGHTGFEKYYVDINKFWRTIYDPYYKYSYSVVSVNKSKYNALRDKGSNYGPYYVYQSCDGMSYTDIRAAVNLWTPVCGEVLHYYNYKNQIVPVSSMPDQKTYEQEPTKYCILRGCQQIAGGGKLYSNAIPYGIHTIYHEQDDAEFITKPAGAGKYDYDSSWYWSYKVSENPEGLNFWFDFLDTDGQIGQYKVCKIGDRAKAVNDTNIKAIYFRDVPTVIFVNPNTNIAEEREKKGTGYTYIKLNSQCENLFSMSSQGKSAMDVLNEWIYSYAYCAESVSISSLPIYYLEPNTRIMVRDDNSGINGEYIVTRLTFPLGHNGVMSITATKAVENLY